MLFNDPKCYSEVVLIPSVILKQTILSGGPQHKCVFLILQLSVSEILLKILFIYFWTEGKGGRKRGRETSMCGCLSHTLYRAPGLQPRHVSQTGNQTSSSLVHRPALNPLSHTSQGSVSEILTCMSHPEDLLKHRFLGSTLNAI